jgi:hypothetical protein
VQLDHTAACPSNMLTNGMSHSFINLVDEMIVPSIHGMTVRAALSPVVGTLIHLTACAPCFLGSQYLRAARHSSTPN